MDFLQETRKKIIEYASEIERLGEEIYSEAILLGSYGEESQRIQDVKEPISISARAVQEYLEGKITENDD